MVNATFNGVDEFLTESADWCISSRPIDVTSISVWLLACTLFLRPFDDRDISTSTTDCAETD